MGYTSYWTIKRDISKRNFDKLTSDMKKIEAYIKTISEPTEQFTLHNANGQNDGVLYLDDQFCFNGDASIGADHESMHIRLGANDSWTFCKTARKPYDLAVCLILISLKYHIRSSDISSDGTNDDWRNALETWNIIFPKRNVLARFKKWERDSEVNDGSLELKPKGLEYKLEKFADL